MKKEPTSPAKMNDLARRVHVAERYCTGHSQYKIADELGVTQACVSKDLEEIRRVWLARLAGSMEQHKAEELAKIDRLEAAAWEAWIMSLSNKTVTIKRSERMAKMMKHQVDGKRTGNGKPPVPVHQLFPSKQTIERRKEQLGGNPAFLTQIAWCIETRIKLLGLVKEQEQGNTVVTINWQDMYGAGPRPSDRIEQLITDASKPVAEAAMGMQPHEHLPEPKTWVNGKDATNGNGKH